MEAIFLLLLIFFFVLLYIIPSAILIAVSALVIKWTIAKFKDIGEPNDLDDAQWQCPVCGDTEDWHRHDP